MIMKKLAVVFTAISLMFVSITATMVYAAPAELPKTGQTTVYSAGDDGSLQIGAAWPSPRFIVASSGTGTVVTDGLTGLMWPQDGGGAGYRPWQSALDYVADLNTNNYLGHNDWRLPDLNELDSLLNQSEPDTAVWLNSQGFTNVHANAAYWSSTTNGLNTTTAWVFNVSYGSWWTADKVNNGAHTWPVRGGHNEYPSIINLPKTGQTTVYAAGDNGDLQKGIAWPSPRFTPISAVSGTVMADQLTGLVWSQDGNTPGPGVCGPATTKTWQEALNYVACLNTNSYLGYDDWRLPNRREIRSLVNYGESNVAAWLNSQGFTNAQADMYWSSSTYASSSFAPIVNMSDGYMTISQYSGSFNVWPMRGGQSESFAYLTISKSGAGTGTVIADKGFILWSGVTGTASYGTAMTVNITAVPDPGWAFDGWSGDCTGTSTCQVTMNTSHSVTAIFGVQHTITVTTPNGGENWTRGTTQTIMWSYTGNIGSSVMIELLKGGVLERTIASSTSVGSNGYGSFAWTITNGQTVGSDYTIRVTSISELTTTDSSDGNFTISK